MSFDKQKLFTPRFPEADVQVLLGDETVTLRVRGLSRAEAMAMHGTQGVLAMERKMLACGMVDPALTEEEVGRWQEAASAMALEPVTEKILQLSGMQPDSAKAAVKEFMSDSDATFPVHPGQGSGDDGGAASGADE